MSRDRLLDSAIDAHDTLVELGIARTLTVWGAGGAASEVSRIVRRLQLAIKRQHKMLSTAGYGQLAQPSVASIGAAAADGDCAGLDARPDHAEPCQRRDGGAKTDSHGQLGGNAMRLK